MFYLIVSKLPIISNIQSGKLFRIFVIGTICYIILHAFLYSGYGSNSELISKYRTYFYYVWGVDLILAGIITKFFGKKKEEPNKLVAPQQLANMNETLMYNPMNHRMMMEKPQFEQHMIPNNDNNINEMEMQVDKQIEESEQLTDDEIRKKIEEIERQKEEILKKNKEIEKQMNKSEDESLFIKRDDNSTNHDREKEISDTEIQIYKE